MKAIFGKIKVLASNKLFLIILTVVIVLFIVAFPHTNTTKVNSDFTGVYTIQKERYLFHTMVEFSVENVCTPGTTVKLTEIDYRSNGEMKSNRIVNCDGTYGRTTYNSNGTLKFSEVTTFIGNSLRITTSDYNKNGLLELRTSELNGVTTTTTNTYYNDVTLKKYEQKVTTYGIVTSLQTESYFDNGDQSSETFKLWTNTGDLLGESTVTYTDDEVSGISYHDVDLGINATVSCDSTSCVISTMSGDGYTLTYNDTTTSYELLLDSETESRTLAVGNITETNYGAIIEDADEDAKAVIESLS